MSLPQLNANSFEEKIYDIGEACLVVFSGKSCHVCKEVVPLVEEEKWLYQSLSLKEVPQILFFKGREYQEEARHFSQQI